jgi:hypothetical protein
MAMLVAALGVAVLFLLWRFARLPLRRTAAAAAALLLVCLTVTVGLEYGTVQISVVSVGDEASVLLSRGGHVVLSGSAKCHVNVTDHLKVNLIGGSMLTFKRTPVFEIDRVVNSTLIKADDARRK